jgi:GNAT superfamily N-acetyltransferase
VDFDWTKVPLNGPHVKITILSHGGEGTVIQCQPVVRAHSVFSNLPSKSINFDQQHKMPSQFKVIQLPRNYDSGEPQRLLQALAQKSKILRLESLQTNAEAFSSTYENESKFEDSVWEDRLKNTGARTLICLDLGGHDPEGECLETTTNVPWVGVTVLMGPRMLDGPYPPLGGESRWKAFPAAPVRSPSAKDGVGKSTMYLINAVYVTPTERGKGLGKQLIEKVLEVARDEFEKIKAPGEEGVCLVTVGKDNEAATGLYLACGFEVVGDEERPRQNGKMWPTVGLMRKLG